MPDKRVPFDLHAVGLTVCDDRIARTEVVVSPHAFDRIPFHLVLGGEVIEMTPEHPGVATIREQSGLYGGTHKFSGHTRGIAQGFGLHACRGCRGWGRRGRHGGCPTAAT